MRGGRPPPGPPGAPAARRPTQDERADGAGWLTPPAARGAPPARTKSWPPRDDVRPRGGRDRVEQVADVSLEFTRGFTPKAAIAAGEWPRAAAESRSAV